LFCSLAFVFLSAGQASAQNKFRSKASDTKYGALSGLSTAGSLKPSSVKALSAILVDASSGQVLFSKNADLPRPPASTTKIMTAILLLENTKPEDLIAASQKAFDTEGSSLHLAAGEKVSAHDLLFAMMLRSANDGCVAAAEHIAGSEARFAEMMTAKAREIGAVHTTFRNCNGLNENPNVTTAGDLAIMARYAARFPEFNEATQTKLYNIRRSTASKDTLLKNHAKFLWKFPGADGVKTGYTVPAGHCFVGGATWGNWRLISVVLKSPDVIADTAVLMKYGFQNFAPHVAAEAGQVYAAVPVRDGVRGMVDAKAKEPIRFVSRKDETPGITLHPVFKAIDAPVANGAEIGTLEAVADGQVVGRAPLVAADAVDRAGLAGPVGTGSGAYLLLGLVGSTFVVRWKYGPAIAEAARRGDRVASILRNIGRRRKGYGQR
jgi:D-alanyl-D-alanine carboxypeptidase (penicillin-binding protein 5/6)